MVPQTLRIAWEGTYSRALFGFEFRRGWAGVVFSDTLRKIFPAPTKEVDAGTQSFGANEATRYRAQGASAICFAADSLEIGLH